MEQTEKKIKVVVYGNDQTDAMPVVKEVQSKFEGNAEISVVPGSPGDLSVLFHELVIHKPDILAVKDLRAFGDLTDMLSVARALSWNNPAGRIVTLEQSMADAIFSEVLELVKKGNHRLGLDVGGGS